jgi:putative Ca2+/H+ antiporter (TMEM165/GDT1 family)
LEPIFIAMAVVAVAELGDKTQLVAVVLARRLRRPFAIAAGMALAMGIMHATAAFGGAWLDRMLPDKLMGWVVAIGFCLMALWMVFSKGHTEEEVPGPISSRYAFTTALLIFLMLEFGDKSQLATVGLSVALEPAWKVGLGATLGSVLANLPMIWLGHKLKERFPERLFHWLATLTFAAVGITLLVHQGMTY